MTRGGYRRRTAFASVAVIFAAAFAGTIDSPVAEPASLVGSADACSNPVLASNLHGWASLDGATVSRDTVGDLAGAKWAFDTSGREFYQPELAVTPGQAWTMSARDRLIGAAGSTQISVDWYSGSGDYLGTSEGPTVSLPQSTLSGGSWTLVAATVTVPAQAVEAHIVQTGTFPTGVSTAFKSTACDYEVTRPSGVAMPVGNLPADAQSPAGWHQVFDDDFVTGAGSATSDGSLPDGKWWGYPDGTPITNSTNGFYYPSTVVSVAGGILRYHLHSQSGKAYAAVESPLPASGQIYGRWDVRYRYEPGSNVAGYKSVWMLWPIDDHWGEGELDFAEFENQAHRADVEANLHRACGNDSGCTTDSGSHKLSLTAWHTATVEWSPGKVTAYTDGHLVAASTTQVPSTAMHLLLQTEASDYGPQAAPGAVVNIDVDWIVGYSRN